MANVYSPGKGFAQATYVDQMSTALAGALYSATDENLIDTAIVDPEAPANGLVAGIGVVLSLIPEADRKGGRTGMNMNYATLPDNVRRGFGGVLVRNQQMDSNVNGDACWFAGRTCNVLRANRVGGRVWVRLENGSAVPGNTVHWIIANTTSHGKTIGSFSGVAIVGDTVELTTVKFCSEADASTEAVIALVELALN